TDAPANINKIFAPLDIVTGIKTGKTGQHRLVVYFQSNEKEQIAEIKILTCLANAGIHYREMIRGERLQESVADRLED
ncbi:hypothetical protein MNBD_GAMMA01-682, partial [hydrothermal vent metagenome]